jgi:hypothetical protein
VLQPSNSRPAHNSADLDPFKFRWLIPISALQVRLGNTAGKHFGGKCSDKVCFSHVVWKHKASMLTRFLIERNGLFEPMGFRPVVQWQHSTL